MVSRTLPPPGRHPRRSRAGAAGECDGTPGGSADSTDPVRLYLREIGPIPLLDHQQEIALARTIERGEAARRRLARQGAGVDAALPVEERRDYRAAVAAGEEAARRFARANLRLVVAIAKKYAGRGLSLPDLIQEGNVGLLRAVAKFDHRTGYRFSTYATWWIRQAVTRALADQGRTIRLPVRMGDRVNAMRRQRRALRDALGREPTRAELARALGLAEAALARIVAADRRPLSLDEPADAADPDTTRGARRAGAGDDPSGDALATLLAEDVRDVLLCLDERAALVIRRRFGIGDGRRHTLAEVGAELGLSRERVRQIENAALDTLRSPGLRRRLAAYADDR